MINKVILIGNVGQDPEIRYVGDPSSTTKVATIRLATSERYKDRSGVLQEHTEWHSVVAWRGTADVVEKYVKKGTQIYVEGRLRTRSWDDQGGNKRYSTEILADTLQLPQRQSWQRCIPAIPATDSLPAATGAIFSASGIPAIFHTLCSAAASVPATTGSIFSAGGIPASCCPCCFE